MGLGVGVSHYVSLLFDAGIGKAAQNADSQTRKAVHCQDTFLSLVM